MGNKIYTVFQNLEKTIGGNWNNQEASITPKSNTYDMTNSSDVIFRTKDKNEFLQKKLELKQQKYLSNMWRNTSHNLSVNTLNGLSAVKMMYRDVELMDSYPEIGAALDLYADEACLSGGTKIKLLNGEVKTIKDLFDSNCRDFWCYTTDMDGEPYPTKIEKVVDKGEQEVCEVTLDDGTVIKCTLNHKFLTSDGLWVKAQDLTIGDSLMSIYDRIVGKGYEQIKTTKNDSYQYTHLMVANNLLREERETLINKGSDVENDRIVVHHKSFNKLNNDPFELQFMFWSEHQRLHYLLNSERWKNEEFSSRMRNIMSVNCKKFWANSDKYKLQNIINKRKETLSKNINSLTQDERKLKFGRRGEQNYFFGKSLKGKESPRYNFSKKHADDINIDEYVKWVLSLQNNNQVCNIVNKAVEKYNLIEKEVGKLHKQICDKYDIKNINDLKYSIANNNTFLMIKNMVQENKQLKDIINITKLSKYKISNLLQRYGYKSFTDLKKSSFNHRIVSIVKKGEIINVYDLMNSSVNNSFAIKTNKGHIISHNCTTSSKGTIINVYSQSDRIKSIIEDLLVNRLDIQITAPMIVRAMCKYGNQFMLLNINNEKGVVGWRQLPVSEIERREDGMHNMYALASTSNDDESTTFTWVGAQQQVTDFRNWQVGHFRLLTDSVFLPYGCLVGSTSVETEYGFKPIKDINIGDKVWTFNIETQHRELSTVTMHMNKGVKDVYRVKTKHYEIKGTDDHKLLTYNKINDKLEYKEIKDLTIGDLLVCDNLHERKYKEYKIDKSKPSIEEGFTNNMKWWEEGIKNIPDYVTVDLARLFGFLIGDGWITKKHHVSFALGKYNELNNKYINLLESFTKHKVSYNKNPEKRKKSMEYNACYSRSKTFDIILKRLGFNGKSYEKRIPKWVFESNNDIKNAFIDGLLDADGYLSFSSENTINCNIELTNENLIRDLKILVQSLGYRCGNVNCRDRIGYTSILKDKTKIISRNKSYYLNFSKNINTQVKHLEMKTRLTNEFILEKVCDIVYSDKEETFDITVDNNNSNFFANGIVTHNCSLLNKARRHWRILSLMEDMMLIYRLERSIERRVYKIYVGAIDDADVPAYIEEIANNFKRTPIIDPMTGQVDLRKNILPVWKKTPIPLIDGRTITIEDLAKEFENGKTNYVYSIQDKTLKNVIGKVAWCGKNYTAQKMLKIWIDNKYYMIMAHEHEVLLYNGLKKRADALKNGDKLMSFAIHDCCHYHGIYDTVTKIEEIDGDDVYCMTVEGDNKEQDRHNFGLQLFSEGDIPTNEGIYVSNCTDQDVFIPVRDPNTPNPIDTLAAAQNLTAIDDIKYVQNKVLAGLRIPKSFLNFEESTGDGKNLALMDVRFARVIIRIQQAFLMELTKIVTIHLYLLGFKDDLTNFTLSMNNPSTQAEQLELENLSKKITTVRDAVSDPGNGLPVMSMTRALKEIMKWSDSEIKANLEEIRLEKALSAEIEKTSQIIKRTGLFDTVDKIYGEPGAEYQEDQGGMMDNGQGDFSGGGSGGLGGGFGDDLNTAGDIGSDENGDLTGAEGTEPTSEMPNAENVNTPNNNQPMETRKSNKVLIEHKAFDKLIANIDNTIKLAEEQKKVTSINDKLLLNDKYLEVMQDLDKFIKK